MKKVYYILLLVVWVIHQSCINSVNEVDSPMTVKNSELTMTHGNTEKLIVENAKGFTTYKSTNDDVATVSPYGIVTAGVKGEATIRVESGAETAMCKVSVTTSINHIIEPCVDFGRDYETVKNKIKNDAEITEENGNMIQTRVIENTVFRYVYLFKDGKLSSSCLSFPLQSPTAEIIDDFLAERYLPWDKYLYSPDKKVGVFTLKPGDGYLYVFYSTLCPTE
ncbi:Ig-like domain-containing protein [Anaerorudis cellulosivorans]|uniref:Ig-like domain-containing protein n=1 Tax=Anaerorudis cellulosivorans TaxID=3397862 RepID=UPI00221F7E40|nr:Ig-like domain-containing protein [Seramator thermalis]MCW1734875.1 Ig-like domain-containing protein [Seramator thermalis]